MVDMSLRRIDDIAADSSTIGGYVCTRGWWRIKEIVRETYLYRTGIEKWEESANWAAVQCCMLCWLQPVIPFSALLLLLQEKYFLGRQEVRTLRRNTTFISGDWLCAVLIDRWVVVVEICRFFLYIQIYWEWAFHSRVKWKQQQQHWVGGELSEDDYTNDHEERRSWWQSMTCLWNGPRRIITQ